MLLQSGLVQSLALRLPTSFFSWNSASNSPVYKATPLSLSQLVDNVATRDFDGAGSYYPVEHLPNGTLKSENVKFDLPNWGQGRADNMLSNGQVLDVFDIGYAREFHVLYAGDWNDGETEARYTFEFEDGTQQVAQCSVKNWYNLHWLNSGPIQLPYHGTATSSNNYNITQIHHWSTYISSNSPLVSIRLPDATAGANRLHIFAVSIVPAYHDSSSSSRFALSDAWPLSRLLRLPFPLLSLANRRLGQALAVKNLRLTTRISDMSHGSEIEQEQYPIVDVTLANLFSTASTSPWRPPAGYIHGNYTLHVLSSSRFSVGSLEIRTVLPARIRRLMPGDDARVDIAISIEKVPSETKKSFEPLSSYGAAAAAVIVELRDSAGKTVFQSEEWEIDLKSVLGEYESTRESLMRHETPRWWRDAKFGIFIHWGIYSVPGWVPTGYYEAWYNWWLHNPPQPSNDLWRHHRKTYGEDFVYDDFIPQFNPTKFDANDWVDLFAEAGAKYFVLVTKHHDGFSLFDTGNTTHRSSVHLGPKRDLIGELMDAAKERQPQLKRGTYYSMPEWFNPAYAKYGHGNFPGGLARNAFDPSKTESYTGHLEGKDYVRDIQAEHMRTLMERYETDIMWCDIGGPNGTAEVAADWYNEARRVGRQVTLNNRCGVAPDFDTPEYARFSSIQTRSWETNEGIDPYCYGYNRRTKDEEYRSVKEILHTLIDIVSKNGNYLLNLGPTGEGDIIPAMINRVKEVGRWLKSAGGCIYATAYSFPGAEEGSLRFTTTTDTFCIIALERPSKPATQQDMDAAVKTSKRLSSSLRSPFNMAVLTVQRPVPILLGDPVRLLGGGSQEGETLPFYWTKLPSSLWELRILVPESELDLVSHAWAFEIRYATSL